MFESNRHPIEQAIAAYPQQYGLLGIRSLDDFNTRKWNDRVFNATGENLLALYITSSNQLLFDDMSYLDALLLVHNTVIFTNDSAGLSDIHLGNLPLMRKLDAIHFVGYRITRIGAMFWNGARFLRHLHFESVLSDFTLPRLAPYNVLTTLSLGHRVNHPIEPEDAHLYWSTVNFDSLKPYYNLGTLTLCTVKLDSFLPDERFPTVSTLHVKNGILTTIPDSWFTHLHAVQEFQVSNMCLTDFPAEQLLKFRFLRVINFSNEGHWPNQNDFSAKPVILNLNFRDIVSVNLNDAHVLLLRISEVPKRSFAADNSFSELSTLRVSNPDLVDQFTTNVTCDDYELVKLLNVLETGGRYISPLVYNQTELSSIQTGNIMWPNTDTNFDAYRIGDSDTRRSFFQALHEHNNNFQSAYDFPPLTAAERTRNDVDRRAAIAAYDAFEKMLKDTQAAVRDQHDIDQYFERVMKMVARIVEKAECTAPELVWNELDERPMTEIGGNWEGDARVANLLPYFRHRLIGKTTNNHIAGNESLVITSPTLTEKDVYRQFIAAFQKTYEFFYTEFHRKASAAIKEKVIVWERSIGQLTAIAHRLSKTPSFTKEQFLDILHDEDAQSLPITTIIAMEKTAAEEHYSYEVVESMLNAIKRFGIRDVGVSTYGELLDELMFHVFGINITRETYAHSPALRQANAAFIGRRRIETANDMILKEDLLCRHLKITPFPYYTARLADDLKTINNTVFKSPVFVTDNRQLFLKKLDYLFRVQQEYIAMLRPSADEIRNDVATFEARRREEDRLHNMTEQERLEERIALETTLEQRMQHLRELAINDPAAMAELTAQMARNAIAAHEMRDPTAAEVQRAIERINEVVTRKVPFFKAYDRANGVDIEGQFCGICLDPFEESNRPYVPSTEHVEMFNPLRANLDYGALVVDGIERFPGQAAVVCHFVRSDFSTGDTVRDDAKIHDHHKHFFHYACAAQTIQSQRQMNQTYHCVTDQTGVYGIGV